MTSKGEVCDTKIKDLVAAISANEKDLAAATKIRSDEEAVFTKNDAELVDVIKTIGGAISKLAAASGSAALAQVSSSVTMTNTLQSLNAIIDALGMNAADKQKLTAFVQSNQASDDEDIVPPI